MFAQLCQRSRIKDEGARCTAARGDLELLLILAAQGATQGAVNMTVT